MIGVETNSSSRFIDHTFATTWEQFVSDIEKGLKHLTKGQSSGSGSSSGSSSSSSSSSDSNVQVEIEYNGLTYTLEKRRVLSFSSNHLDDVSTAQRMFSMYGIKGFILFSPSASSSSDCIPSMKMTISSAFITAVKAINFVALPAFFSYSVVASDMSNLKVRLIFHRYHSILRVMSLIHILRAYLGTTR